MNMYSLICQALLASVYNLCASVCVRLYMVHVRLFQPPEHEFTKSVNNDIITLTKTF